MEMDFVFSILFSAYGYSLTPTADALSFMGTQSEPLAQLASAVIPLFQYYLHGVLEFGLLWERPDTQIFTFGTQHLAPYVKALDVFHVMEYPDFRTDYVYFRPGVFTTFFGPLWVDFGWAGVPLMLVFGVACKHCGNLARRGSLGVMPLYAYLCVVIFFIPVLNLIVSAQGMYTINAFLLTWIALNGTRWSSLPSSMSLGSRTKNIYFRAPSRR
jgi:hypothetical protein